MKLIKPTLNNSLIEKMPKSWLKKIVNIETSVLPLVSSHNYGLNIQTISEK